MGCTKIVRALVLVLASSAPSATWSPISATQATSVFVERNVMDSERDRARNHLAEVADKAIGDGDHGIGMARGFEAVGQKLETQSFTSIGEMFKSIGMTLMTSIGGAAGAVFGQHLCHDAAAVAGRLAGPTPAARGCFRSARADLPRQCSA